MSAPFRWTTFVVACAVVVVCAADHTATGIGLLLTARDAMFVWPMRDTSFLSSRPEDIAPSAFRTDDRRDIAEFSAALHHEDAELWAPVDAASRMRSDVEKAQIIMLALGSARGIGECGLRGSLLVRLQQTHEGEGCCSDYSKSFLALSEIAGLVAREVSSARHTVVEFYDHSERRWVFADPYYQLLAKDGGDYASLLDVASHARNGRPLPFVHVSSRTLDTNQQLQLDALYAPSAWGRLMFVAGNNVIAWDRETQRLSLLPRPVRQAIVYALGVRPSYLSLPPAMLNTVR
jgi:hypothetical protein